MNIRLTGTFTLRSPLSHIGETISTTAYLVEEPIHQPDGSVQPVFCYSGNAWRGQLRDLCAAYMLRHLDAKVPLDAFHLLFAGGAIGGDMIVDVARAQAVREAIPMLALFGGGLNNQILAGQMQVSNCYPLCSETSHMMPEDLQPMCLQSYRQMTMEKSFSRRDDSKDGTYTDLLARNESSLLEGPDEPAKARPEQMRMTVELLCPGVTMHTGITLSDVSDVQVGALVSALWEFSKAPYIGGQSALHYDYVDLDTGSGGAFLSVRDRPRLLDVAQGAKDAYDAHLHAMHDQYLRDNKSHVRELLGVRG